MEIVLAILALLVSALALVYARTALGLVRHAVEPLTHRHAMEVVKLSFDAEAGLAVFDLRCAACGATGQRVVDSAAVARLAKAAGCTEDEARAALMNACGDPAEAERRVVSA